MYTLLFRTKWFMFDEMNYLFFFVLFFQSNLRYLSTRFRSTYKPGNSLDRRRIPKIWQFLKCFTTSFHLIKLKPLISEECLNVVYNQNIYELALGYADIHYIIQ